MAVDKKQVEKITIGWQEWCALPNFHLPAIKAKIDTGAKTSAIHAFDIRTFIRQGKVHVEFSLYPLQANKMIHQVCSAEVIDQRWIMSSNGQKENRFVIQTDICMAKKTWTIELSLSDRDPLQFRLLLGRAALSERVVIDPSKKLCLGRLAYEQAHGFYQKIRV